MAPRGDDFDNGDNGLPNVAPRRRLDTSAKIRREAIKHYLRYIHLRWQLDHEKDKAKQKELSLAILTFAYRTRYEYMNHWAAMRQTFAGDAAKKLDEPTWVFNDRTPKPWIVETPVSREETEQWFREGLEYFQPTPVMELKFSSDLVPVAFPNNKPVAFRMPCCDSLNTVSPRFYAEIFNKITAKGNFLAISSSVFNLFTPNDPAIPERFRKLNWVRLEPGKPSPDFVAVLRQLFRDYQRQLAETS